MSNNNSNNNQKPSEMGVGKHYINPVGRHYIGPVCHEVGSWP